MKYGNLFLLIALFLIYKYKNIHIQQISEKGAFDVQTAICFYNVAFLLYENIGSKPNQQLIQITPLILIAFIPYFLLYLLTIIFLTNKKN